MGIFVLLGILYFPPIFLSAQANHHIYYLGMLNGNSRPLPQSSETPFTSFNKGKKFTYFIFKYKNHKIVMFICAFEAFFERKRLLFYTTIYKKNF